MDAIAVFYNAHPFWVWVAAAALMLAAETVLGSGYLLWPALAAGLVAVAGLLAPIALAVKIAVFVAITLASTVLAKRLSRRRPAGRFGETVGVFKDGQGRAVVDGAEWVAVLDAAKPPPAPGTRVEVVEVLDPAGRRVKVRPL